MLRLLVSGGLLLSLSIRQCREEKKSSARASASPQRDTLYVAVVRTGCYGRCPIDKVELLPDGTVQYRGERFVERIGLYKRQLSEKEQMEIRQLLKEAKFEAYKEVYDDPHVTDLPSLILSYKMGSQSKQITCRTDCPPELPGKIEKIRSYLADQGNFQMIEGPKPEEDENN
ncbi:MAG: DUF6438 domain-containing protein [Bacteroidia bacterium]|nr:DUF6438 domain-containing protein [Bacteroidia bacterium]MCX7763297.1 DUF6438 domain-containing protein [Bacteroidia bacterium]MDW8058404.1 DUF6438 domain-containing protein [Bacteroidia bacterium]